MKFGPLYIDLNIRLSNKSFTEIYESQPLHQRYKAAGAKVYLMQMPSPTDIRVLAAQRLNINRNLISMFNWWKQYNIHFDYEFKGPITVSEEIKTDRTALTIWQMFSGINHSFPEQGVMKLYIVAGLGAFADGMLGEAFEPFGAIGVGGPLPSPGGKAQPDARRVWAHEIGHVFGLPHVHDNKNLMSIVTNTDTLQNAKLTDDQVTKIKENMEKW